ncbi:MAG: YebC/PmpR family DNA-binding transcriptional regulator, partial [Eubacteriales bacterium]|nr:YebC/PmpR family DNA-binding transcriptional regulator [Eubacteriales bacterium]MDD4474841.1 YebC/PmpR family DNA-binding transcriptional regulator [Eubacteriales bacterium]
EDEVYEITTELTQFDAVKTALTEKGYNLVSAEIEKVPSNYVTVTDEESVTKMNKLLEMLEDNDDVQNVWHNWED